jgi:type IV secretory pathway VirB10-like protein
MTSPSALHDKNPKPPGLLPKNVQSWLLAGLAVLMVVIMWLTGGKKPVAPSRSAAPSPAVEAPLEVNEAKIVELQNRIEQLQREQSVAQSALSQQGRALTGNADPQVVPDGGASQERAEDSIREERKRRGYLSLFASNVALSYRKGPDVPRRAEAASTVPASPEAAQLAELLRPLQPPLAAQASAPAPKESAAERERKEDQQNPVASPAGAPALATGKTYVLFEGTLLETVLLNRLDGQFQGPIECLVTSDVYSHDRQHLLIPAGTKVLGEARKVESFGQTRLAVFFHRMVMPDGYSASLDRFQGLNQTGDAGLRDQVNNHYVRLFGVSLAIGAIGAVAEAGTAGALTASGSDLMRQGFAQSMGQSSAQILDRFLNVRPTVTIREGHRIKVYLSGDLALSDYATHTMAANL